MATAVTTSKRLDLHHVVAAKDDQRKDVFCVLLKRSYDIRGRDPIRAEKDRPLDLVDDYYRPGDPETCCVRFENDLTPFKIATDVVVVGKVYAPGGKSAQVMDAAVDVAGRTKTVRVFGDRQCRFNPQGPPDVTDPAPFTQMEMRFERAYGGTDSLSILQMPFSYPRNHLGRGFILKNSRELVDKLVLPNFEDPADLLSPERIIVSEPANWWRQPIPQGFGWFQRTWYPRCSFVGSVPGFVDPDTVVREEQLGLVPQRQFALARQFKLPSFDIRFNNGAPYGQAVPFLKGGELIRLANLTADSLLQFTVPLEQPRIGLDIGTGMRELAPVLQTVLIRPDDRQVDLLWRGALEYPGVDWLPEMRRLEVEIQ
jgi:hypothetical protein